MVTEEEVTACLMASRKPGREWESQVGERGEKKGNKIHPSSPVPIGPFPPTKPSSSALSHPCIALMTQSLFSSSASWGPGLQ